MRERITVAFVLLTIGLLLGAGVVRSYVLRDLARQQQAGQVQQQAQLVGAILEDRQASGRGVDRAFLATLVGPDNRLTFDPREGRTVAVSGADYDGTDNPDADLSASVVVPDGTVTVSQSAHVLRAIVDRGIGSIAALFVLVGVVAGLVGFLISSALSAPFKRLAVAAAALGRGRFDLDLPRTRIPEARAISTALATSARQLEDRLHQERDFAEHASHVLRTPLTGLRLELEDLTLRDDVRDDVKEAAGRSLAAVDEAARVAAELVDLTRRRSLVEGAELPLVDLATQLAQRWADRLAERNRTVTAAAEGDLALTYTPGPVEQVTDLMLADVVRRGTGAVRIVFHGEEGGHLRIHVDSAGRGDGRGDAGGEGGEGGGIRSVAEALGGHVSGAHPADGIEVLLPRR